MIKLQSDLDNLKESHVPEPIHFKTEPDCPLPSSRIEYVKTFQLTKRIENLKKHLIHQMPQYNLPSDDHILC